MFFTLGVILTDSWAFDGEDDDEDGVLDAGLPSMPSSIACRDFRAASSLPYHRRILEHTEWKVPSVTRVMEGGGWSLSSLVLWCYSSRMSSPPSSPP